MSQPVVLILGNDSFSTRVAEIARDSGNTVALASPVAKDLDKIRTIVFDPAEHDSFVAAFEATLSKYGHITAVIGAFVPQPAAPGAIYGTDQTALRTALDPSVRLTKVALHYARRQKGGLTIVWLALTGSDVMVQTAGGAITGVFRAMIARFSAHGGHTALVSSEATDDATAKALVACINPDDTPNPPAVSSAAPTMPKRFNAKMHVVDKDGKVTTIPALQGSPHGFQFSDVFHRLGGLVMFSEDVARWRISNGRVRALTYMGLLAAVTFVARRYDLLSPFL